MSDRPEAVSTSPQSEPLLSFRAAVAIWGIIILVALGSLAFFYTHGLTNLYGDALAHMEGARRVFDSRTPGFEGTGSVWLPLFHILAAPLALNDHLWRTGLAGSLVSTAAFGGAAWFLFRLGLEMNGNMAAGLIALAVFLLCPNMLYLASTPMTEPLALLWSILTVYALFRFQVSGRTCWVAIAGGAALLGTLTRYDEWYALPFAALFILLVRKGDWQLRLRRALIFLALACAGPLLWFMHCAARFGNPLEFFNGPYSAQAIYARQVATTAYRYPTDGSFLLSARYYLEDLKLIIGPWPLELAALGVVAWVVDRRWRDRRAAALLLIVPLAFYVQSMAHAGVPLYVPTLVPYTYYNLRYGLEMLPAIALLVSFISSRSLPKKFRAAFLIGGVLVLGAQAAYMFRLGASELPVAKEAILNTPCRSPEDQALIHFWKGNYNGQAILMQSGEWPSVAASLGIPLRKIIGDTDRQDWLRLAHGDESAIEWIVRGENDAVDLLIRAHPGAFRDFQPVYHQDFPDRQSVTVYRRKPG